jgi:hypothetical protein
MELRSGSLLGAAWLVFNLLASVATAAAPESAAAQPAAARNELEEKFRIARFGEDGEITMQQPGPAPLRRWHASGWPKWPRPNTLKAFLDSYRQRYPGATPIGHVEVSDDTANNVITITLKMKSPTVTRESDANWTVPYLAANFAGVLPPPSSTGGEPLTLMNNTVHRYAMEIEFPDKVVVFGNPRTKRLHDDAFDFSLD